MRSNACGAAPNASSSPTRSLASTGRRTRPLTRLADGLIAILFDPACAACGGPLASPSRDRVCDTCWNGVTLLTPPLCVTCGDALASWRTAAAGDGRCARCRRRPGSFVDCRRASGVYAGPLRDIIHAWKYGTRLSLTSPLAALLREAAAGLGAECDFVVPVPLHPRRRRERGFNQAVELARRLGPPVWPCLRRVRHTGSQASLPAAARRRNVRDAFALAPVPWWRSGPPGTWCPSLAREARLEGARRALAGRHLLLVDDVCTTGATLEACAAVLKAGGAARVSAVTVARALPPRAR